MIKESEEVLSLIQKSRNGDDDAYNDLYFKYQRLLHGKYIKRFISSSVDFVETDDINSIMNLIFVEALNNYNPKKSKFITHLTLQIRYKFLSHYVKERMIAFSNNTTKEKMINKLNNSRVTLHENISDFYNKVKPDTFVVFEFQDQILDMPIKSFIETFLPKLVSDKTDEVSSKIYERYTDFVLSGEKALKDKLKIEFGLSLAKIEEHLTICSNIVNDNIKFKTIKRVG